MFSLIIKMIQRVEKRRKAQLLFLFILIILSSFAELVSIGAIIPFLTVITSPEDMLTNSIMQPIIVFLDINNSADLQFPITIGFIIIILIAALLRLSLLYVQTRLGFAIGADFSRSIYNKTLYQPYITHTRRNSSEVVSTISLKANTLASSGLIPVLTLLSSLFILTFILIGIILVDPLVSLILFSFFGLIYALISLATKEKLLKDSVNVDKQQNNLIKVLQEGFSSIRDIIIDSSQGVYTKKFEDAHYKYRRAQGNIHITSGGPRYIIEAFGMIIIIILSVLIIQDPEKTLVSQLPMLGVFAIGAQKILPILQSMFASISTLRGSRNSLISVFDLYDQETPLNVKKVKYISFNKSIKFKNISFRYGAKAPLVLNKINLTFSKGDKIGIIGESGSGKSTFLDIIIGLIQPYHGGMYVDDLLIDEKTSSSWQRHISHVPQMITLLDCSVAENIAFGIPLKDIDFDRVHNAALKANIAHTIDSWEDGYQTTVGEKGVRISGGQLQRIGLARAFYKGSNVIVLDEATSALDDDTETQIINNLESFGKDLTIIIVAHRLSTLKHCSTVIKVENGNIKKIR
jgi:ATP-binding cassette, subfamily B, bacterial PglK